MAKENDVIFSSEKLETRERRNRILIPAIALVVVIAIAVAASFIVRHMRGTLYSGGGDTAYPYTWRNNTKGVMTLEIDKTAGNGQNWIALNNNSAYIPVEAGKKQPEGKNRFLVTPQEEGRHSLLFVLVDESVPEEEQAASAVLELLTETTVNGKGAFETEVISSALRERQIPKSSGADTYYPYTYSMDENGYLTVTVAYPEGTIPEPEEGGPESMPDTAILFPYDWAAASDNESVATALGTFYENGGLAVYIGSGSEAGTCRVTVASEQGGVSIVLTIERNESGALLVRSDEIRGGDHPYEEVLNNEEEPSEEGEPSGEAEGQQN